MLWQSVFLEEWERLSLENLSALGVLIEVLPTIIVRQSSFVSFSFYLFIFLWFCFGWKSKRLGWWGSVNEMHHPLLYSLPLEIIPVYFGNGSQRMSPLLPQFRRFAGKLHADFLVPMNTKWRTQRGTLLSSLLFFIFCPFLCLPLCFCLVRCPHCFNVKAWARSHMVPDISLWAL